MMRRCVLGIAIAVLIAGGVTFAQQQGRMDKFDFTFAVPHQPMGPCGDAVIYGTYEIDGKEMDRYDKRGQLIQAVAQYRTVQPTIYWLGTPDPGFERIPNTNVVMGVAGEVEIDRLDFATGRLYAQGSIFQATVPGYGRIFSETGHGVMDMNATPWANLVNRGHNDYWEQDLAALCDYLRR
jgi:hypothetical protein